MKTELKKTVKDCPAMGCFTCVRNKNCHEYAVWNKHCGYSASEEWQRPKKWKVEGAKISLDRDGKTYRVG